MGGNPPKHPLRQRVLAQRLIPNALCRPGYDPSQLDPIGAHELEDYNQQQSSPSLASPLSASRTPSPLPFRPDVTAEIPVPHAQVSAMYPPSVIGGRVMTREERFQTALTCREEGKVTPKPRTCAAEVSVKGDAWRGSERLGAGGVSQGVKPRQGCAAVQLNRECKENTRTPEVTSSHNPPRRSPPRKTALLKIPLDLTVAQAVHALVRLIVR